MFMSNPFADAPAFITPAAMQAYVLVMFILVVVGTIYDVLHKKSARFFLESLRKSKSQAIREVGAGETVSLAIKTAVVDVAASGEFCNLQRRIAHLLTMYGFLAFVISTVIMVFSYPTAANPPAILPQLWHLGALMICIGGYWFWFFIRVDVSAEGSSPFRVMYADVFVLALLASATFALLWSFLQAAGSAWGVVFFWLHILSTTLLFGSVPWSKFAHMFFKPAAAYEKRLSEANGSRNNLPPPADVPAEFGSAKHHSRHY
ncbi:MAG: adenylyl-sulfate reductase [Gammaproteobacteria bacterium]|nr:adenylyl-sulfate reductase [Gammaproteobacteria bacterium]